MSGCSIRSTAPILHLRHAGLGHADRADAQRRAGVRHDAPAVHRASASPATAARRAIAGRPASATLHVRACATLADAMLFTTSPLLMNAADRAAFGKVEAAVRLSRYGGDCYAYCMLAAGHVDLVIETGLKPYDIVPLIPIIAGAGGIVTTWEGGPPQAAAASSPPATSACTQRRWSCSNGRRYAQNSGVPGTKASNAAQNCARIAVLLHQHLVAAPATIRCEPARSRTAKSSIAGVETIWSLAGGDQQQRLADLARHSRARRIRAITRKAAFDPGHGRRADAERGLGLEHRLGARIAHRIGGQRDCR